MNGGWAGLVGPDGQEVMFPAHRNEGDDGAAWFEPGESISEADAQLIEAAPGLLGALHGLLDHVERETCMHEETERLGFLWTRCIACGRRWADDEGGMPDFEWPAEVEAARAAIASAEGGDDA